MSSFLTTTTVGISANILTKSPLSSSFFSPPHFTFTKYHLLKPHRSISVRAVISSSHPENYDVSSENQELDNNGSLLSYEDDDVEYPGGEFEFENQNSFWMKLRMLIACQWERVRKGSVLKMELRGQISDQLKTSFFSGLSLPQICENLINAAYDHRISGVYFQIETLNCGWGITEEIRRHILDFRKSGLYSPPSAYFSLYGLTAQAQFYGVIHSAELQVPVHICYNYVELLLKEIERL
ncbi:hypothetical protein L1987_08492 [Smallanthus sonchifolius]|uniref:Uncharacterized protein n=1 Tax=Smallanthus sonchifolius TaxID=185202 RepID=A0ACB9JMR4_9ASTR|nr:hypothetical protein L1987_08492 [Smallanthus sonchifolius]